MTLDVAGVLRDAWAYAKRDRDILLGVAGMFLFLPDMVEAVFIPGLPMPKSSDQADIQLWMTQYGAWSGKYGVPLMALALLSLFGALALFMLYTDRGRPAVAGALRQGAALLPYYLLLALSVAIPVSIGWVLVYLPGLYLKGRLMVIAPVFVAERPIGVFASWRRSFALTRGNGLTLMALACVPLLGGQILALPFDALAKVLNGAPMANPVVAAVLDICMSGAHAAATIAAVLIEVALYRRLSNGT